MHDDLPTMVEFMLLSSQTLYDPRLFEYYPLSSNRAHRFMKEDKSTILNREFKETYRNFLVLLALNPRVLQS